MKTLKVSAFAVCAAFLAVGCNGIDEMGNDATAVPVGEIVASIDASGCDTDFKASYKTNLVINWKEDDEITVGEARYKLVSGKGTPMGSFIYLDGTVSDSEVNCFSPADMAMTWPAVQGSKSAVSTAPDNVPLGAKYTVSGESTERILFSMLGGVLCFELSSKNSQDILDEIRIESAVQPVCGEFSVVAGTAGTLKAVISENGGKNITYVCPADPKYSNISDSPKRFYVSVPANTYDKLTVTFVMVSGATVSEVFENLTVGHRSLLNASRRFSDLSHECVQLWAGGPYWATCNLGASSPEEAGWYLAWGATEKAYDSLNYVFVDGSLIGDIDRWEYRFTFKDNPPSSLVPGKYYSGWDAGSCFVKDNSPYWIGDRYSKYNKKDGNGRLDPEDDAATVNLGEGWRTPTRDELDALFSNCTYVKRDDGFVLTGKGDYSGKSIFLPFVGYASYKKLDQDYTYFLSSERDAGSDYDDLYVRGIYRNGNTNVASGYREYGYVVRPVFNPVPVTGIALPAYTGVMFPGETYALTPKITPWNAYIKDVKYTTSDTGVADVDEAGVITAIGPGKATITAVAAGGLGASATFTVSVSEYCKMLGEPGKEHKGVQLWENGPYWATCNLGGKDPMEARTEGKGWADDWFGDYYQWGNPDLVYKSKSTYITSSYWGFDYPYYGGGSFTIDYYNTVTGHDVTVPEQWNADVNDAARAAWGSGWRLPTKAEIDSLAACTVRGKIWEAGEFISGAEIIGKIDSNVSIFMIRTGRVSGHESSWFTYGHYWSSELASGDHAYCFYFDYSSPTKCQVYTEHTMTRYMGIPIRPVYDAEGVE